MQRLTKRGTVLRGAAARLLAKLWRYKTETIRSGSNVILSSVSALDLVAAKPPRRDRAVRLTRMNERLRGVRRVRGFMHIEARWVGCGEYRLRARHFFR
jgi:hypothetical protein